MTVAFESIQTVVKEAMIGAVDCVKCKTSTLLPDQSKDHFQYYDQSGIMNKIFEASASIDASWGQASFSSVSRLLVI